MTVIGYVRASTEDQKITVEMQDHEIVRWCKDVRPDKIFVDAGVSGGLLMERRPAGKAMLEFLENSPGPKTLVIWKMDRLFRGLFDAVTVLKRFDAWGVSLVSLTEHIDMTTPAGRAFFHMLVTFAELERGTISERIKASKNWCRRQGRFLGSLPTYGFKKVWRGEWKRKNGRKSKVWYQEPDFLELAILAKVKELDRAGYKAGAIARFLLDAGMLPRRGGPWHHMLIKQMLAGDDATRRRWAHLLPDLPGRVEA